MWILLWISVYVNVFADGNRFERFADLSQLLSQTAYI